jgi:hypothetical protein
MILESACVRAGLGGRPGRGDIPPSISSGLPRGRQSRSGNLPSEPYGRGWAERMAEREFTLAEARALLPEVRERAAEFVRVRADLAQLAHDLQTAGSSELGGVAESKAFEAQLSDLISWFDAQGIEVKSLAPLLLDFPGRLEGRSVRLCWLEGDAELAWYHLSELGFPGRRPLRA